MMTTATDANVHAIAIDGTFDDCQAIVKSLFSHRGCDRVRLSGVNSINFARIVALDRLLFHRRGGLGRAAPQGRLHRADREFR